MSGVGDSSWSGQHSSWAPEFGYCANPVMDLSSQMDSPQPGNSITYPNLRQDLPSCATFTLLSAYQGMNLLVPSGNTESLLVQTVIRVVGCIQAAYTTSNWRAFPSFGSNTLFLGHQSTPTNPRVECCRAVLQTHSDIDNPAPRPINPTFLSVPNPTSGGFYLQSPVHFGAPKSCPRTISSGLGFIRSHWLLNPVVSSALCKQQKPTNPLTQ